MDMLHGCRPSCLTVETAAHFFGLDWMMLNVVDSSLLTVDPGSIRQQYIQTVPEQEDCH